MPGVNYTVDTIISGVKRRITLPDAQNLYSDADLLAFMGDELSSTIEPLVHAVQQEYWVEKIDVALVANQTDYTIPTRGIVNGLRLVTLLDNAGNEIELPLLRPEMVTSTSAWLTPYSVLALNGFELENDHIIIFPQQMVQNPVMSVRFRIERQPSQLCATTDAGHITAIVGNVVTVDNIPSDWTTSLLFDVIKGQIAFVSRGDDLAITNIDFNTNEITFSALPSTVVVGDWVAVQGTSPIPQIPYQMFPYLAQCVANLCMAGMADLEPYTEGLRKAAMMKEDLLKLMQPRDMGNVQTVVNRGGFFNNGNLWSGTFNSGGF